MNITKICNTMLMLAFAGSMVMGLYFTDRFAFGKAEFTSIVVWVVIAFFAMATMVIFDKGDTK